MEFSILLFSFRFSFLIDIPLASFPGALLFVLFFFRGTDIGSGIQHSTCSVLFWWKLEAFEIPLALYFTLGLILLDQ